MNNSNFFSWLVFKYCNKNCFRDFSQVKSLFISTIFLRKRKATVRMSLCEYFQDFFFVFPLLLVPFPITFTIDWSIKAYLYFQWQGKVILLWQKIYCIAGWNRRNFGLQWETLSNPHLPPPQSNTLSQLSCRCAHTNLQKCCATFWYLESHAHPMID